MEKKKLVLVVISDFDSMKYQLIDVDEEKLIAKGVIMPIGLRGRIQQTVDDRVFRYNEIHISSREHAAQIILETLQNPINGVIRSVDEIGAVAHRVLHGGIKYSESTIVTQQVKDTIRELIPLAPYDNDENLMGIEAFERVLPGTPQVVVFDTAFHQTIPPKAYLYGLPKGYADTLGIRKYGFQGISHRYASDRVCKLLGVSPVGQRVIICHLGNDSSLSAVKDGKCIDTTMGFTQLDGLLSSTRCGSCDPSIVQFLVKNREMSIENVEWVMNTHSGLRGISGISDMRDLDSAADNGSEKAVLARDMLIYGIQKYIGAFTAAMGGVNVIVFTGDIGENNAKLRASVIENMEWLGAKLDSEKNDDCTYNHLCEKVISSEDSRVYICVIPTNEALMIARDAKSLCDL